jgi:histidine triad (HIT) family protein
VADCLFCKIAGKEIDSDIVFESDRVVAFRDINPAAPTHILVIPRRHVESVRDLTSDDADELAEIMTTVTSLADQEGLERGYRIVTNVGYDAGQSVHHLHFHLLGGRGMSWPPG